jgi:hypothetical protein
MAELSDHEKYLAGIPLTEELAAVRAGKQRPPWDPDPEQDQPGMRPGDMNVRVSLTSSLTLTRGERVALKEGRQSDFWPALMHLLEITCKRAEARAILLSHEDPLGNAPAITQEWAYVAVLKKACGMIGPAVDEEVKKLDEGTKQ